MRLNAGSMRENPAFNFAPSPGGILQSLPSKWWGWALPWILAVYPGYTIPPYHDSKDCQDHCPWGRIAFDALQ